MTEYVLCFAHPQPHVFWPEVLLIEKRKPDWQYNRWNLPGGKIEEGETIHEAARRELQEETGIECPLNKIRILGTIEGADFIVYVCRCDYDSLRGQNVAESQTNEIVFWLPLAEALRNPKLIDNLRLIIPFCRADVMGWHITSEHNGIYIISDERKNEEAHIS